jgi:hypothetical protein
VRYCRYCAYRIDEGEPGLSRSQVAEATSRYLAAGGAITRLPPGPRPPPADVRLNEEIVAGLRAVPWDEVAIAPLNADFNVAKGGRDVSPEVTSLQAAANAGGSLRDTDAGPPWLWLGRAAGEEG